MPWCWELRRGLHVRPVHVGSVVVKCPGIASPECSVNVPQGGGASGSPLLLLAKELTPRMTCRSFLREGDSRLAPLLRPLGLCCWRWRFALVSVLQEHLVAPAGSGQRSPARRLCWGPSDRDGCLLHPGGPVVIPLGRGSLGTCFQSAGNLIWELGEEHRVVAVNVQRRKLSGVTGKRPGMC